ncbi:uncharacterized protein K441DRAFT_676956 [Cenococcum geophilum 1.58]|uniref:uncharacterized protein n=1 Tax=Cenococcum geophilum 1.58 TaxID=794803 RepID=UPI00358EEC2A|nr:hypothetical protein K441DRAFT_676956 [Cenococcum geophilum 1.58]
MGVVNFLLGSLNPILLLRTFYLAAAALILLIYATPTLRTRFLAYGSRATSPSKQTPKQTPKPTSPQPSNRFIQLLDHLTTYRVPHSYFTHFYILSILCSILWLHQLRTRGPAFQQLAQLTSTPSTSRIPNGFAARSRAAAAAPPETPSMTVAQVYLVCSLMLLQGLRRLAESCFYTSDSKSQMWIGHYALGVLFYSTVNIAVWIEGTPPSPRPTSLMPLDLKSTLLVPLLLTTHILQNAHHAFLSSLRRSGTYALPTSPLFPRILCPHYTLEVLHYTLLALLAAPAGRAVNYTLAAAVMLVAVNLGVTAEGTRGWCVGRFGAESVKGRARMLPWVW